MNQIDRKDLTRTPSILIVDDDIELVEALSAWLIDEGYRVLKASNGREGLEKARRFRPDLVLADINMPVMSGLEMARALAGEGIKIVFISGQPSRPNDLQSIHFVHKPFDIDDIGHVIRTAAGPPVI